jgi:hypothetical protein
MFLPRLRPDRLNASRAQIFKALIAENIGVNVHYIPVHMHPYYRERFGYVSDELDVRGGRMNDSRFGSRMRGSGPRWEAVERLFEIHCRRHGLRRGHPPAEDPDAKPAERQGTLFP